MPLAIRTAYCWWAGEAPIARATSPEWARQWVAALQWWRGIGRLERDQ